MFVEVQLCTEGEPKASDPQCVQDSSFDEIDRFLAGVESHGSDLFNTIGHGVHSCTQSISLEAKLLNSAMGNLQA